MFHSDDQWEEEMRQFGDENTENDIAVKNAIGKYIRAKLLMQLQDGEFDGE